MLYEVITQAADEIPDEEPAAPPEEKTEAVAKEEVYKPKPLAKIVGRVVIPVPEKRPKSTPAAKQRPSRPARPANGNVENIPTPGKEDSSRVEGKGKKKSKRVVAIHGEEEDLGRKGGKAAIV